MKLDDIVLDTNCLKVLLGQYYKYPGKNRDTDVRFHADNTLNPTVVRLINQIISSHFYGGGNYVVASTFAFVEIARQFAEISDGKFLIQQFKAFIDQPPVWFVIAAVEKSLYEHLLEISATVKMPGGDYKKIEWADAIHYATALSRDNCKLATTDVRLRQLDIFNKIII